MSQTVVIGAGIIGVAVAFELQRRGSSVVLIDRDAPGNGASFGNMASIAVTEFMPSSRPCVWARMPRWLLDPEGPVHVRLGYLPALIPWFVRFLEASRPSRVRELEAAGAVLCGRVFEDLLPFLKEAGLSDVLSDDGCLSLYANETEFASDRAHMEVLKRFGFQYDVLDGKAARSLEPSLSKGIAKAILFPQNRTVRDPHKLVVSLVERFTAIGGVVETGEVNGFETQDGRVVAIRFGEGRRVEAARTILCAGAFTARLSHLLNEFIPLESERGYHTQISSPGISMRHSIIWPARAFMVTPTAGGIRVGGTVEMAGLDAPPDFRRAKVLVRHAKEALPDLQTGNASEWMGHRPAMPDTVPVIGPSATHAGVFYATGHGHLGLTYAATTARLIGDLVHGVTPPIDLRPYRVDRF